MYRAASYPFLLLGLLASGVSLPGWATSPAPVAEVPAFRVEARGRWVHEVRFDQLAEQTEGLASVEQASVAMFRLGVPVPLRFDDDGDGRFGPGESFQFLAAEPEEPGRATVYQLRLDGGLGIVPPSTEEEAESSDDDLREETSTENGSGSSWGASGGGGGSLISSLDFESPSTGRDAAPPGPAHWVERRHLEEESLRVRLAPRSIEVDPEIWYWHKLTFVGRDDFETQIPLSDLDRDAPGGVTLHARLRGWSTPRVEVADHRVEAWWQGHKIGDVEWNGQDVATLTAKVPWDLVAEGSNSLKLHIAPRRPEPGMDPIVDVQLLDWIELQIPRRGQLEDDQARLHVRGGRPDASMTVRVVNDSEGLHAWDGRGQVLPVHRRVEETGTEGDLWEVLRSAESDEILLVTGAAREASVETDSPSAWRFADQGADHLIIAHGSLIEAARPLAEFHREQGLDSVVIDVQDLYDEFGYGEPGPEAIRDFIRWTRESWTGESPRFVLLVGDASWDPYDASGGEDSRYADWTYRRGERRHFAKNGSTPYADGLSRDLLPTWSVETAEGPAASDNPYVDLDGDRLPDLAIGRFPVARSEEVEAIVAKTIDYARRVGSLDREGDTILWVTNEQVGFQRRSDRLAERMEAFGYESRKIYPAAEEKDNLEHQEALLRELGEGPLLVHFLGHGGRYIWRTGPPDLKKNHDLFTLEHLDRLTQGAFPPVILSMTCYSAPFDHPTADSIGEKFLRMADRGAVAVFAASWRNSPSGGFSQTLLEEMHGPGTLGEAVMEAKRQVRSPLLVETYNLLGDPALSLASRPRSSARETGSAAPGPDTESER